jgi:hypothetical protein
MEFKLVKLDKLSGNEASVYAIQLLGESRTLFDHFISENINSHSSELKDILSRLRVIGHDAGAQEDFFKHNEGNPGDGICALYDKPRSHLRLYCIRYGSSLIILGGGGPKAKKVRRLQDDPKLKKENYLLRDIARQINQRIKDREITFYNEGKDLEGEIEFYENQD